MKIYRDTTTVLQFFSRYPVSNSQQDEAAKPPQLNQAIVAFPIAGLVIGALPALIWFVTANVFNPYLAASLAIMSGVIITGALHEDGLADCADGIGATNDRERALEIMRDSTIGTYGASALFFSFILRVTALASLDPIHGALAILMAHSIARMTMAIALFTADYARPSGLANAVREGINKQQFLTALALGFTIMLCLAFFGGLLGAIIAFALAMLAASGVLQVLKSRLGGYTGDGLGAMEQVAEITILITLAGMWT